MSRNRNKFTKEGKTSEKKGYRNTKESRNYSSRSSERDPLASTSNDVSWYSTNPALVRDTARIPFTHAMGTKINLSDAYETTKFHYIPGLLAMELIPSYGYSEDGNSPLNKASVQVYNYMRQNITGTLAYDATDVTVYLAAMSSVYSYINWLQRLYAETAMYSDTNRYFPEAVAVAERVNYEDLYTFRANLRYGIDLLIDDAASLSVPAELTIFKRHAFLYQNIYCEGTDPREQMYMYVPVGFHVFDPMSEETGGMLHFKHRPSGDDATVSELLKFGREMLDIIRKDDDMNQISGHLGKVFQGNIIRLASLPDNYTIQPIYDPVVLEQFKNATIISEGSFDTGSFDVKQSGDSKYHSHLVCTPTLAYPDSSGFDSLDSYNQKLYNLLSDSVLLTTQFEPNEQVVMENTRLMLRIEQNIDSDDYKVHCGSEIPVSLRMITFSRDYSDVSVTRYIPHAFTFETLSKYNMNELFDQVKVNDQWFINDSISTLFGLANFKYHPCIYPCFYKFDIGSDELQEMQVSPMFDVDIYGIVQPDHVKNLHEAALINMLRSRPIGKLN